MSVFIDLAAGRKALGQGTGQRSGIGSNKPFVDMHSHHSRIKLIDNREQSPWRVSLCSPLKAAILELADEQPIIGDKV